MSATGLGGESGRMQASSVLTKTQFRSDWLLMMLGSADHEKLHHVDYNCH